MNILAIEECWMRVLLIDDEPIVLQTLLSFMEELGHMVICASSYNEVELQRGELDIDLIITDLSLPGVSGRRFLNRLKEHFPGLPIVAISGHESILEVTRDSMKDEIYAFLKKPFSLTRLESLLKELSRVTDGYGEEDGSSEKR